jgi:hypothetical protein
MVMPARVLLAAAIVCLVGCESPTDLHRGPRYTNGVPQNFYLKHWTADIETQTLLVESWGIWGVLYTLERSVTEETTWMSSNPAIARVVAPGRIQSVSPGEVTLTATLDRFTKTETLRVFPGDAPTRVKHAATGTVRDSSVSCCANLLAGVTLEILTGYNAGRSAVTDAAGRFTFSGPFYCGESMIRLSKLGYREVVRHFTWCSEVPQSNLEMVPGGG